MPLQAGGVEEVLTSMEHPQLCSHAILPRAHQWVFPPPRNLGLSDNQQQSRDSNLGPHSCRTRFEPQMGKRTMAETTQAVEALMECACTAEGSGQAS